MRHAYEVVLLCQINDMKLLKDVFIMLHEV